MWSKTIKASQLLSTPDDRDLCLYISLTDASLMCRVPCAQSQGHYTEPFLQPLLQERRRVRVQKAHHSEKTESEFGKHHYPTSTHGAAPLALEEH